MLQRVQQLILTLFDNMETDIWPPYISCIIRDGGEKIKEA